MVDQHNMLSRNSLHSLNPSMMEAGILCSWCEDCDLFINHCNNSSILFMLSVTQLLPINVTS